MQDTDPGDAMHRRTPPHLSRQSPLLAAIGALAYTVEGATALRAPQPDQHWNAAGYAIEIAFAVALLATIPLLPLLSPHASRGVRIATRVAQIGSSAMLVDAIASTAADGNVLGPVFFLGLLGTLGGLVVMTISQVRTRLECWWLCPVVLAGLLAGMALGDHGGGLLIGISWATVAITLRRDARSRTGTLSRRATVPSAAFLALALALICAGTTFAANRSTLPTMHITLNGTSISAPRAVPSGALRIVSTVSGKAPDRTVSIVRLNPGTSFTTAFARVAAHRGNPDYLSRLRLDRLRHPGEPRTLERRGRARTRELRRT
jgi:hypothetical protein